MKKIFCIITLLIYGFYSYSQDDVKSSKEDILWCQNQENSRKTTNLYPLRYIKIAFHIVRTSAGTTERQGIETDIKNALVYMNSKYVGANVQFYICDINYINNDTYYNFNTSTQSALMQTYNISDAINIYLFNTMVNPDGSNVWGYTYYPCSPNIIALRQSTMDELVTVTHELGHFFRLPHTHDRGNELVDGSNCATAGDCFCDTPADPNLQFDLYVNENCEYTGTMLDANGDPYNPDVANIMSYARHKCRNHFSPEQLAMVNYWANQSCRICFSHMSNIENTIISTNQTISEDVIILKNVTVQNNSTIILQPCTFVEISGNSEITLGSTLDIQ